MESYFDSEFFRENRNKLKVLFTGTAPIILTANGLLQSGNEITYPFQQDSNFWYLTGIDEPDVVLVMDKDKEYLIVPQRSKSREIFEGSIDNKELVQRSGIKTVMTEKEGWKQLETRLKRVKHVATLAAAPAFVEAHGFYTNPARAQLIKLIREHNPEVELLDLREHLARLRMIKQEPELAAMRQAISITLKTLQETTSRLDKYHHEYEIEAEITKGFRGRGALGHAYSPIVASGANACIIHYMANNALLQKNTLVLIDAGASVEHYAADITRTYTPTKPTKRQQTILTAVQEVQDYAVSLLKPGVVMKEYERLVEHFMGEKLRELGLIKTINKDNVRHYYPHGTSHFLGLDVHDVGDYMRPLEPGMVLTVEPGIYIAKENIGVRIEDDVLITEGGTEVLSATIKHKQP